MNQRSKFFFDALDLIALVEKRSCLWDNAVEDYKDRSKKLTAWNEIYNLLIEDFDSLETHEKDVAGKAITEKWRHLRDAFNHSLKAQRSGKSRKKYMYHNQLKFLLKILDPDRFDIEENGAYVEEQIMSSSPKRIKILSQPRPLANSGDIICTAMTEMDEDTAFFASVVPTVKNFSDDEKLDFRMGVLALIQEIKAKRKVISEST